MKERPILFSAPMVRAILDGRKTQTRRILRNQPVELPDYNRGHLSINIGGARYTAWNAKFPPIRCPYGQPGDRLWVRETLRPTRDEHEYIIDWHYAADGAKVPRCPDLLPQFDDSMAFAHLARAGVPSIHMPRWASRITLEVTGVRVERLQAIAEADAVAEGAAFHDGHGVGHSGWRHDFGDVHADARSSFARLWEQINGAGSWDANPWVWCISFRRIEQEASQ